MGISQQQKITIKTIDIITSWEKFARKIETYLETLSYSSNRYFSTIVFLLKDHCLHLFDNII